MFNFDLRIGLFVIMFVHFLFNNQPFTSIVVDFNCLSSLKEEEEKRNVNGKFLPLQGKKMSFNLIILIV
jgi:hypothetical protein